MTSFIDFVYCFIDSPNPSLTTNETNSLTISSLIQDWTKTRCDTQNWLTEVLKARSVKIIETSDFKNSTFHIPLSCDGIDLSKSEHTDILVKVANKPMQIRSGYLSVTNLQYYFYTDLFTSNLYFI